jgi:hypothetical protein
VKSDREAFRYTAVKKLSKDGTLVREKRFEDIFPRDFQ